MGEINKFDKIPFIDHEGLSYIEPQKIYNRETMINDIVDSNSELRRVNVLLANEKESFKKTMKLYRAIAIFLIILNVYLII
ncbi:MAG: hypothetical protein NF693_09245 [Bombella sp.]|nr:hypothetical protein [Bombella sp.]